MKGRAGSVSSPSDKEGCKVNLIGHQGLWTSGCKVYTCYEQLPNTALGENEPVY